MEKFSSRASQQIYYAVNAMPLDIFRKNTKGINIEIVQEFIKTHENGKALKSDWDGDYKKRLEEIKTLKDALNEQKNAYNFIGLFHGFDNLATMKRKEKKNALYLLSALGMLTLLPIIYEFYLVIERQANTTTTQSLLSMIPAFSLIFILVYYFRISLHNYKSINTQLSQIELRKSLCMFIQKYAEYSQEIKKNDSTALDRFESIIFSNIVMNDEKIPSTFDGLEPLANLIKSAKS